MNEHGGQEAQSKFDILKASLADYRAREPKARQALDGKAKRALASQVAAALAEGAAVLDVIGEAQTLPGVMIAEGIGEAWPQITPGDRQKLLRWVSSVDGDKRASLATRLASLLLAADEPTRAEAVGVLLLAPDSKDAVARLASDFLGPDSTALDRLRLPEPSLGGLTLALRLLRAAKGPKVQEYRRVKVLQLVLGWITAQPAVSASDRLDVVTLARDVKKQLTETTSPHMSRWLAQHPDVQRLLDGTTGPPLEAPVPTGATSAKPAITAVVDVSPDRSPSHLSLPPTARPPGEAAPPGRPQAGVTASSVGRTTEPAGEDPTALVVRRIADLRTEATVLETLLSSLAAQRTEGAALRRHVSELERALERARLDGDESDARVAALTEERQKLVHRVQVASADLDSMSSRLAEVEAAHGVAVASARQSSEAWAAERSNMHARIGDLEARVQATAVMRLEELRNRIAAAVRKAMRQVPERGSAVTHDQSVVVLARFYEVLEALEDNGIQVGQSQ